MFIMIKSFKIDRVNVVLINGPGVISYDDPSV